MTIATHNLKIILAGFAALVSCITVEAACISTNPQQPTINTNFSPLTLQFNVHVTNKLDGINNSTLIDQSFIESLTINQSFQQITDICSSNTSILSNNVVATTTANTTDVSNYAGKDFSLVPNQATLITQDSGRIFSSSYQRNFSISANSYSPLWNNTLNQYTYANYSRRVSLDEYGLAGFYLQPLDLTSYLQSHIGTSGSYNDFVAVTNQNYQTLGTYGFFGTATLIGITAAVPEPSEWLMILCGLCLVGYIATHHKYSSSN